MSWTILFGLVLVLGFLSALAFSRRSELDRMERVVSAHERAKRLGSAEAQLQHPVIDLTRCLGCGTCVSSCPEDGVLELVHGQSMVVNGARCMGISACERECPTGAITVTLDNVESRDDIPVLSEDLEAVDTPGLFLAGEVTAQALIKTALDHGSAIGAEVGRRTRESLDLVADEEVLDLVIVGAGPAGLACSLEARSQELRFMLLDQEMTIGGAVAKYPRRKLVLTQPTMMPIYGLFERDSYEKEELMALWQAIATEQSLPFIGGVTFDGLARDSAGNFIVRCGDHHVVARHVCLAIGRRGVPRQLGVPGEELPKVMYSLVDASSYRERRILVVGGGDNAVETAIGLASQPGNHVILSYRKESFFRVRSRNDRLLHESLTENKLELCLHSEVKAIGPGHVELIIRDDGAPQILTIPNDEVFVMAGGTPPFELLERSGVSFDPARRPSIRPPAEQGNGLTRALAVAFGFALCAMAFALYHADYYFLSSGDRPTHVKHALLRPGLGLGLGLGIAAVVLVIINLLYLARRSPRSNWKFGSLRGWMTAHVATGIVAVLCATLHGAMAPRNTVAGHGLWLLVALLITGAIGRYFYAYLPRAANGRELALEDIKTDVVALPEAWEGHRRRFGEMARDGVLQLIRNRQWSDSFFGRVRALFGGEGDLRKMLNTLEARGLGSGVSRVEVLETLRLARRAHRTALIAAHYEDLRAIIGTWRYLHRWGALLMIVLVVLHICRALIYGEYFSGLTS